MPTTPVTLKLSEDEALVLFEWLTRVDDLHALSLTFVHEAEQKVVWTLEAALERKLAALFAPNYKELVEQARARVRDASVDRGDDE